MTPTKEQELNEKVASLCPNIRYIRNWDRVGWYWFDGEELHPSSGPATDLNACAELLRMATEREWDTQIRNAYRPLGWECRFWKAGKCEIGEETELPIAICRAFIAVMEGRTE